MELILEKKNTSNRLKWFGYVLRRKRAEALILVKETYVWGMSGRGKSKMKQSDVMKGDMKLANISEVDQD